MCSHYLPNSTGARAQLFVKRIVSGFKSYSEADKWCDALEGNVNMIFDC